MSTKAWSWTRMKTVTQHYWICTVKIFGKTELIAYSGETVHNAEDRTASLENFIKGIKAGNYTTVKDSKITIDKRQKRL
jgi:hypothetical protein